MSVISSLSNAVQAGALVNVVASTVNNFSYILDEELKYINVTEEQENEDSKTSRKCTAVCSCRTSVHSESVILISFHRSNVYANAPHCCVIGPLPVLLSWL